MKRAEIVGRRLAAVVLGLCAAFAAAGQIVPDLDDSAAIATFTAATSATVTVPNVTTGVITYAARFSPDSSMAGSAPVIIIEDGGTSNGTGLYLVNGSVVFAGKYGSLPGKSSLTLDDTDFTDSAIAVTVGQVAFGAENKVYLSYDLNTGGLVASVNGVVTEFVITGSNTGINFDGNNSVFFLAQNNKGWLGGLGEDAYTGTKIPELTAENCVSMVQTTGYTNQLGQIFSSGVTAPQGEGTYAITVEQSGGSTAVAEGYAGDSITLSVSDNPGAYPLTITITDTLDPDQVTVQPAQVVFDSANWQTAQTVTVTAIDDDDMERATHYTAIAFGVSADSASGYFGKTLADTSIAIEENDCGAYGYSPADFNLDCQVDLLDMVMFFDEWMSCSTVDPACQDFRLP